jgi:hypothetical protein
MTFFTTTEDYQPQIISQPEQDIVVYQKIDSVKLRPTLLRVSVKKLESLIPLSKEISS